MLAQQLAEERLRAELKKEDTGGASLGGSGGREWGAGGGGEMEGEMRRLEAICSELKVCLICVGRDAHTCTHVYTHMCTHTHAQVCMIGRMCLWWIFSLFFFAYFWQHTCTGVYDWTHVSLVHVCVCVYVSVCVCVCMTGRMGHWWMCVYVCMYLCVYVCV